MLKPAIRRSACDQCRAKRVRCLRAQDSTAPCARCRYTGARCITGAAGHPGRPPKQRLAVPSPGDHQISTLGDTDNVPVHGSTNPVVSVPAGTSNSAVHAHSSRNPLAHESQEDFWTASGDISASLYSPSASVNQSPVAGHGILSLPDHFYSPSQLQGFFSADDELDALLSMEKDSDPTLGVDIEPMLDQGENLLPPSPLQCFSTKNSLMRFRDEIDEHITTVETYYSDTSKLPEHCKDEDTGRDVENPAALLLVCTKEFTDIIQSLLPTAESDRPINGTLSTEIILLALSSYLALMRLFDCVFHRISNYLCKASLESWESIKVKSVLRIGGVSSLQDMPLKMYAIGVLDAIKAQVQTLERCMGIPAEYCLSGETSISIAPAAPGIFSSPPRARLFWAVMAQEDVQSLHDSKSYVESIRASIKDSMAFFNS